MTTIKIPNSFVVFFGDYHQISDFEDNINEVCNIINKSPKRLFKSAEIDLEKYGFEFFGQYCGIFWTGTKPDRAQIKDMIAKKLDGKT